MRPRTRFGWLILLMILSGLCWQIILPLPPAESAGKEGPSVTTFAGGPGDSLASAVIIQGAADHVAGVQAEYRYLREKFGQERRDWRVKRQELLSQAGKVFDVMHLELANGAQPTIYFDITDFFGKI
jgi:hypothetical protein